MKTFLRYYSVPSLDSKTIIKNVWVCINISTQADSIKGHQKSLNIYLFIYLYISLFIYLNQKKNLSAWECINITQADSIKRHQTHRIFRPKYTSFCFKYIKGVPLFKGSQIMLKKIMKSCHVPSYHVPKIMLNRVNIMLKSCGRRTQFANEKIDSELICNVFVCVYVYRIKVE